MQDFGNLRSLLTQPAHEERWASVCAILDTWPEPQVREHLPYLRAHLGQWPAHILRSPASWAKRALTQPVPQLSLVKTLVCAGHNTLRPGELEGLAASLLDAPIERLELHGKCMARASLAALFALLPNLRIRRVRATRATLGLSGLEALLESRQTGHLTQLYLERESIGEWGARAIAEHERAPQLEALSIVDAMLSTEAMTSLLWGDALAPRSLSLDHNRMTSAYGSPELFKQVRALSARGCGLGDFVDLARFLGDGGYTMLLLDDNALDALQVRELVGAGCLEGVEVLGMSGNEIGDEGLASLLASEESLASLRALDLSGCDLTDEGAVMLARAAPSMPALASLSLGRNIIGERGRRALRASPQLGSLL